MKIKMMQTMFAAAVMLAAAAETFGGEKMQNSILTEKECAVADIGAAVARGDQTALAGALNRGFDAGMTLNEAKEYVGQLYAYCGFPRALNAAATLMKAAAEKIRAAGMTPGIWLAPFAAEKESRLAAEHPDWLLHGKNGDPVVGGGN